MNLMSNMVNKYQTQGWKDVLLQNNKYKEEEFRENPK
jgi:hypothetical protein